MPSVDLILEPYAEKSYQNYTETISAYWDLSRKAAETERPMQDVVREFEQGFQGWEYKFNTVASQPGRLSLYYSDSREQAQADLQSLRSITMLNVQTEGQGKKGCKKPVLFPKIVFLYDENLHGPGKPSGGCL